MQTLKVNDVILKSVVRGVVFIVFTLGMYLFFAGHNAPGGGFIGGLVLGSGIVLLYLTYDIETVHKGMPFDFKKWRQSVYCWRQVRQLPRFSLTYLF